MSGAGDRAAYLHKREDSDDTFFICGCTDGASFDVVAVKAIGTVFISKLTCSFCQQEIPVCNGIIGATE